MATCRMESKPSKKNFHNWLKSNLALMYTRNGLKRFVSDEINSFQRDTYISILKQLDLELDTMCSDCSTNAIVSDKECEKCKRKSCQHTYCPKKGLCNSFLFEIRKAHKHKAPSWNNTDARQWCSDPWQLAKCYMPEHGYSTKRTIEETDLNGVLSVILNNKIFARKLSADPKHPDKIFQKARTFSNKVRHEATYEIDDDEFENILSVLISCLEVQPIAQTKEAQDAIKNILELKDSKWYIHTSLSDIYTFLNTSSLEENDVQGKIEKTEKVKLMIHAVKLIESRPNTDFKSVETYIESISEKCKELRKHKMRKQLQESYEKECSTLPISALFEDEDAPLLSFYVLPTLRVVDYHRVCSRYSAVNSYTDIFCRDGEPVQNIYITGDAGIGKTAVCQRMILCWCHAMNGGTENDNFSRNEIESMKCFDFLFFISLRESYFCHVKKIIKEHLKYAADQELIDQILDEEKCLIVLDGLDEWTHQPSCCTLSKNVPDRQYVTNLTYLTTTRPWKIEANRLKTREVDQQIELKGLDNNASEKLTCYVINHLNNKYQATKNVDEYRESFEKQKQIRKVSKIPIIKIQLITLWFQDQQRTNFSRCVIYGDTIQMLFERAIERNTNQETEQAMINRVKNENGKVEHETLSFLSKYDLLTEFQSFLFKLGHLAFGMLFNFSDNESVLVFERDVGKRYGLIDEEMQFSLFVGILSKNKAIGPGNKRLMKLTFLHKSYQEFFAALYIAMNKNPMSKVRQIFSKLKSVLDILKYENFFIFLSGMNTAIIDMISNDIRNIVSSDKNVETYRQSAHYKFELFIMLKPFCNLQSDVFVEERNGQGALKALQTLLLQCLEESPSETTESIHLPLSDIFIDDESNSKLIPLIMASRHHLKSVSTEHYCAELASLINLKKLVVKEGSYPDSPTDDMSLYENCISSSKSSLVSLSLAYCKGIPALTGLDNLKSLALFGIVLKHEELSEMFFFISKTEALTQLFICNIKCSEHLDKCNGSKLDLTKHCDLKYMRLQSLYENGSHQIRLNNKNIEFLVLQDNSNGNAVQTVVKDIKNAPKLAEVVFVDFMALDVIKIITDTVPTLHFLERLSFFNVDFGDNLIVLNKENQKSIKMVTCLNISLTFESFCSFVDSLPTAGVNVLILSSKISCSKNNAAKKDMEDATNYVRASTYFEATSFEKSRLSFNSKNE
ncbi:uncharacterized protein LOC132750602 [Ruditapes philippinarum]|uniref:uncharacterized protein LOC132750602 n=1 Tax=Ruditapes philippinarum TaxID=129788 RepID=UPI00295AD5B5|nr:uncharacterized protein LOC132750602 [Ruditapes philippinarum]